MKTYDAALIETRFAEAENIAHSYYWLSDASQVRDRVDVMLKRRAEITIKDTPDVAELVAMICKACIEEENACEGPVGSLKTERCPSDIGIGYLTLKKDDSVKTVADVVCNLDFNEAGDLLGVEFMSWPKDVKQQAP